ncbi:MAG: hypothetical protein M1826_001950 [Phylliscum demangeonii]|nr:MAG: hypothetical protein M1826_001950 [Phylliscum demangeonii]
MAQEQEDDGRPPATMMDRTSLCLPSFDTGLVMHHGEPGFREEVARLYHPAESDASERLMALKMTLRDADTDDFWRVLMEGLLDIAGAQFGFVAKRILLDDDRSAVEMPPIGEPGSCLMAEVYVYNDQHGTTGCIRKMAYSAHGAPCAHMRHDKVFLIPDRFNDFITDNPNPLPFPAEAYLALPLFSEGKCFAHFGFMWTAEGVRQRALSWPYLEMLLHSLEDRIQQRLLDGDSFGAPGLQPGPVAPRPPARVIPHAAILASQSLKPYARSLSHELRTPMQGVVGMLDIMHATVQESAEAQGNAHVRKIFETLRENIEVVQDSSRRAVEAADNVVHAYDLNMNVPDTPESVADEPPRPPSPDRRGRLAGPRRDASPSKRRRSATADGPRGPVAKYQAVEPSAAGSTPSRPAGTAPAPAPVSPQKSALSLQTTGLSPMRRRVRQSGRGTTPSYATDDGRGSGSERAMTPPPPTRTMLRRTLRTVIGESLQVGRRPESIVAAATEGGERIEVRSTNARGELTSRVIRWRVDAATPDCLLAVDERDLAKLVSCVFRNAVKFTEEGQITMTAELVGGRSSSSSSSSKQVVISITDTGPGMPPDFLPNMFKPFSREDESLTRQKDGLGLGLMIAKGLARKMGGDVVCTRSQTAGPERGSTFEIRVPWMGDGAGSLPDDDPAAALRTPTSPVLPSLPGSSMVGTPPTAALPPPPAPPALAALAPRRPLTFLVAEDNQINRRLLVNMLSKLGHTRIHEAYDGAEAVRQMAQARDPPVDIVLMDLWMPNMDGFEASRRILGLPAEVDDEAGVGLKAEVGGEEAEAEAEANQGDDDGDDDGDRVESAYDRQMRLASLRLQQRMKAPHAAHAAFLSPPSTATVTVTGSSPRTKPAPKATTTITTTTTTTTAAATSATATTATQTTSSSSPSSPPLPIPTTASPAPAPAPAPTPDHPLPILRPPTHHHAYDGAADDDYQSGVSAPLHPTPPPPPIIVAITADATAEARARAARVGMRAVLTKPYTLADLDRFLDAVVAARV